MNNFFSVLLTTLKNSIISVWTKVRYWLTPSFWQSKVLTGLRNFLQKLFDVKPHDKNDYFTVRNWMISRRLGFAVVIVVGLISLYFLITVAGSLGLGKAASDGVRVYRYTSIPLRFAEGNVKIKARSGYIAYEGNVKDGYAEGYGNLYSKDSNLIYSGEFGHGRYNGTGTLFYADGQTQYEGEFADNCFQGTGILYRLNGSKEYEGRAVCLTVAIISYLQVLFTVTDWYIVSFWLRRLRRSEIFIQAAAEYTVMMRIRWFIWRTYRQCIGSIRCRPAWRTNR